MRRTKEESRGGDEVEGKKNEDKGGEPGRGGGMRWRGTENQEEAP